MLDASKAFDCVNYCKLFRILLEKKLCSLYCRLLLNMYINKKLTVRWESTHSPYFDVTNGIEQGGVISPILFCIYMDGPLHELENSGVGCYMGGVFVGATCYPDDLKLLTPSVIALNILVDICKNYATKYVMFNTKKSLLIIYKCTWRKSADPNIYIDNAKVPLVNEVIHFGHNLSEDIFKLNASKCVAYFNRQCNMYFANFKYANSNIRNVVFHKYRTSLYCSQVVPIFNSCMEEIYIAWRLAIRRVWMVPWTNHCKLLPDLANCMDIELWFSRRCMRFIKMTMNSSNIVVKTITNMGIYSLQSVMGAKKRFLQSQFYMEKMNVYEMWKQKVNSESDEL